MTKKDYARAATIAQHVNRMLRLPGVRRDTRIDVCNAVTDAFVELFAGDGVRFDVGRFRAACIHGADVKQHKREGQ